MTADGDWDPEGWRVIMKKTIPLGKYLGGVLMQMAMVEATAVAVALLRKFRFEVRPGHDANYRINVILFMRDGLPCTVHAR